MEITPEQMNAVLPEGVRVREFYESGRKAKELTDLRVELTLEYDRQTPQPEEVAAVLGRESLPVEKRTKRGMEETDIKPLLHDFAVSSQPGRLTLQMTVSAQNPALNPMLPSFACLNNFPFSDIKYSPPAYKRINGSFVRRRNSCRHS